MEKLANPSRRNLFRGKVHKPTVPRLPWVISDAVFTQNCSQCMKCIDVCETQVIVRDTDGFPKVNFDKGECTFCQKCIESCDEPLFDVPLDEMQNNAKKPWPFELKISDKCLAKNSIYCQSCRDECEPRAINFSYIVDDVTSVIPQPNINLVDCSQCGACVSSCPQQAIELNFHNASEVKHGK